MMMLQQNNTQVFIFILTKHWVTFTVQHIHFKNGSCRTQTIYTVCLYPTYSPTGRVRYDNQTGISGWMSDEECQDTDASQYVAVRECCRKGSGVNIAALPVKLGVIISVKPKQKSKARMATLYNAVYDEYLAPHRLWKYQQYQQRGYSAHH